MTWLKIAGWLVLTLVAMRLVSWALAWIASRLLRFDVRLAAILANLTGFLLYVLGLRHQLEPGEPIDRAAVVFGAAVCLVYLVFDFSWVPWRVGTSTPANVASGRKKE
jgi:hypothetical protein